jgi:DNA-binding CsgD family transcriptional regulator
MADDDMFGQDDLGGLGAMMSAPLLFIDVRQWNKKLLLQDEGAAFGLAWPSGEGLLVIAQREAVKLRYEVAGEQVTQEIPLTWTNGRPSFLCPCGKQVTKLYFAGRRFVCRRCYLGAFLPARPKRPKKKKIPAKTRLQVLARDGFRCVGCGGSEGGLRAKRAWDCDECLRYNPAFDGNLCTLCQACSDGLRRGFDGAIALTRELHGRGKLNLMQHDERSLPLPSWSEAPTSTPCQIEEMKHVPHSDTNSGRKTVILAPETAISVYESRQFRHKQRIKRTHRILLKLLAGVGPSRIAREEFVSRSTVWRYRRRLPQLVPIVRRMMRDAARRQDWQEARFWSECLANVGAEIDGDHKPRGVDAREWRERLEVFRDGYLRRLPAATASEQEARRDRSEVIREIERLTEHELEERWQRAIAEQSNLVQALSAAAWQAEIESEDDARKVGRSNFLFALYGPIQLAYVRVAFAQWAKGQRG